MTFDRSTVLKLILVLSAAASAVPELARAQSNGFLPERLDRIDQALNRAIDEGEIPGAVALIVKDGETAYHKAFGYSDLASRTEMSTDTIFRIASMSKAITSVATMILYEQGRFRLNDPVEEYLPEFADMRVVSEVSDDGSVAETVPATASIRIIDLLTHTSGISYPFIASDVQKTYVEAGVIDGLTVADVTLATQMALLAKQPLLAEPRGKFTYGLNTDVLGHLIESVSGMPLDRFIATNVTGPLGMDDTHFYLPPGKRNRLATLYAYVDDRGLVESDGTESDIKLDDPDYPVKGAMSYFSGGAGLSSTAGDYARFCQMLLNGGVLDGTRILGRKSVELMRAARIDWDGDQAPDFGLGFHVVNDIGREGELGSEGTFSWGGAFYTSFWIDPEESLVAVFMSQVRPARSDIDEKFNTLVYQALQ